MPLDDCTGYRFGDFEVQLRTETLLRKGYRVRIQKLPFQMLLVLLEKAGQSVTREELRGRLWSDQGFGEFDNSLHVAAAKLREALGDQATAPRFLKTISREGYQFIAEVVPVLPQVIVPGPSPQTEQPTKSMATLPDAVLDSPVAPAKLVNHSAGPASDPVYWAMPRARRKARWLLPFLLPFLLVTAVALAAVIAFYQYDHRPLASPKDRIVLGEVINSTGDTAFNGTLSPALRFKLQESPYLSLVDSRKLRQAALPGGSYPHSLQDQLALCTRVGAQLFLAGEILNQASGYGLQINAWRCRDGQLLTSEKARAINQAQVLPALDQAVLAMRRRLGESEGSLEKFNAPLAQATTSSLAALKAFTMGEEKRERGDELQSISDFKLAVDLDPQFALAYARLGTSYANSRERTIGRQYYQKAFDLRERTTDRERLYIAAHYYAMVTGEDLRSIDAYQLWHSMYARDSIPLENLVDEYLFLGHPEKAMEPAETTIRVDPDSDHAWEFLARTWFSNGRYAELEQLCHDPGRNRTDRVVFHEMCYRVAFQRKDQATMTHELQWAHGSPQESILLEYAAWCTMNTGKLAEARRIFAQARENAQQHNLIDFAAELDLDEAGLEVDLGLPREAREHALDALKLAPNGRTAQAFAALTLARAGESEHAQVLIDKVSAEAPLDTVLNAAVLPAARASIQMQRHQPRLAIQLMETARPYDANGYMALSPAYYRGMAYLEDKQYDAARREFQHDIDLRLCYPESIYITLSKLQIGHVAQLTGRVEEASTRYREVDELWKDADADFQPLLELRSLERTLPHYLSGNESAQK